MFLRSHFKILPNLLVTPGVCINCFRYYKEMAPAKSSNHFVLTRTSFCSSSDIKQYKRINIKKLNPPKTNIFVLLFNNYFEFYVYKIRFFFFTKITRKNLCICQVYLRLGRNIKLSRKTVWKIWLFVKNFASKIKKKSVYTHVKMRRNIRAQEQEDKNTAISITPFMCTIVEKIHPLQSISIHM